MTLRLPAFGLGGGPLGNLFHAVDDATALSTMDAAWACGVRFFDTAPHRASLAGFHQAWAANAFLAALLRPQP